MNTQIEDDEPLDPVMEKVRVKMVRLMVVSIGVMVIALLTVLGAIVYKINQGSQEGEVENDENAAKLSQVSSTPLLESIDVDIPDGASIISSSLFNSNMMFDLRMENGERQFWIVNLQSGKVISRVTLK